jgi:hypothetical protein
LQPERDNPGEPHPIRSMQGSRAVAAALTEGQRKFAATFGI